MLAEKKTKSVYFWVKLSLNIKKPDTKNNITAVNKNSNLRPYREKVDSKVKKIKIPSSNKKFL